MDIEVLDYFRRLQAGEYGIVHLGVLAICGALSVTLAHRVLPGRQPFDRTGWIVVSMLAPLMGLVLTSTTYPCAGCDAPAGCQLVRVGVPFPQEIREKNPQPGVYGRCWLSLTSTSMPALAGNFALGTLALPLVLTLFRPRSEPEGSDPSFPTGPTLPTTGPDGPSSRLS